jgi:beta-galactosidase GanA
VAAILPQIIALTDLTPTLPGTPPRVEVVRRESSTRRLWFFINHDDAPVTLESLPSGHDLVSNLPVGGPLTLPPNAVAVILEPLAANLPSVI